jgi:plasmid stability protein
VDEELITMTLTIELPPELEQRLEQAAARHGQAAAEYARRVLEERLLEVRPPSPTDPWAGMPRRPWSEVIDLAREQGASLSARLEELAGNFWPEDETCDEFIATVRRWRREENPPAR